MCCLQGVSAKPVTPRQRRSLRLRRRGAHRRAIRRTYQGTSPPSFALMVTTRKNIGRRNRFVTVAVAWMFVR